MIRNFLFSTFFFLGIVLISLIFIPSLFLPQKIVIIGGKLNNDCKVNEVTNYTIYLITNLHFLAKNTSTFFVHLIYILSKNIITGKTKL